MNAKRVIVVTLLVLITVAPASFAKEPQGGRESLFLLGAGARALGMGGAFSALADDASGVYWNPAGLSLLQYRELSLMHISLYDETSYDFVAAVWPILDLGAIGIGGIRLGTNSIEFRDRYGPLGEHDYATGQYWVSYGRSIYKSIHGGINFKLVNENLGDFSATTAGIDFGILFRYKKFLSLGVNLQDAIAGKLKLSQTDEDIPYNIKSGLAISWKNRGNTFGLAIAGDIDKTEDQPAMAHLGGEVMLTQYLYGRAGYDREYMTFGGGIKYRLAAVDYAYKENDFLGGSHRVSLTFFFGPTISEQRQIRIDRALEEENVRQESERLRRADELWLKAFDTFTRNELDSATVLCSQVLGYNPNHEDARELLNRIRALVDQRAKEEVNTKSHAKAREEMVSSRVANGLILLNEGKLNEARIEFVEALKLEPENLEAQDGLAQIDARIDRLVKEYRSEGNKKFAAQDYGGAVVAWNKVLELKPDLTNIRRKIKQANNLMVLNQKLRDAVEAYSSGDTTSARSLFDEVLKLDEGNTTAIEYLEMMNQKDVPVVTLDELKADSTYWEMYLNGLKLFRDKQYEKAIEEWQKILDKYPGSLETKTNIEQARLRMGQ